MSGRNEKAVEAGLTAMRLHQTVGGAKSDGLWMCYIVASSYIKLGNPDKAEEFSLIALSIDEECLDAYYILCIVCYRRCEWTNLEKYASQYLELRERLEVGCNCGGGIVHSAGDKWRIHVMLAEAWLRRERCGKAQHESENAVKCARTGVEGLVSVGDVWRRTGNYHVARGYYLRALETERRNVDALFGLALINKAAGKTNRYRVLMDYIDTDSINTPHILLEKGRRWLELGKYAEAQEVLCRGMQLRQSS